MSEAASKCAEVNAKLPLPLNDNENSEIFALKDVFKASKFVLDGDDTLVEGEWRDSNGESLVYFNWDKNQPNNSGKTQHYITIEKGGVWADDQGSKIRDVICEKTLQGE